MFAQAQQSNTAHHVSVEEETMNNSMSDHDLAHEGTRPKRFGPSSSPGRQVADDLMPTSEALTRLGADRTSRDLSSEVRILFAGAFVMFPLPHPSTLADLAEKLRGLERFGAPHRIDLLLGGRRPAAE
jgi:hypothetical protein